MEQQQTKKARFPPVLDLDYYRSANSDLRSLTNDELISHFDNRGKVEGLLSRRGSEPGSFVTCGPIYPKSRDIRGKQGFFGSLFRRSNPSATPLKHVYNAEELGRLLMQTLGSQ
jgi:hypothetical protein